MKKPIRYRNAFLSAGLVMVSLLWVLSDPDVGIISNLPFGGGLVLILIIGLSSLYGIGLLFLVRKALMDYDVADFEKLGIQAKKTPEGAGLYSIAVAIKTLAYAIVIAAIFFGVNQVAG